MDGETVLLHASGLAAIIPPGLGTAYRGIDTPPGDVFSWPMSASTLYASDALWIENEWGVLACVDPATGAVRDSEQDRRDGGDLLELLGTEDHLAPARRLHHGRRHPCDHNAERLRELSVGGWGTGTCDRSDRFRQPAMLSPVWSASTSGYGLLLLICPASTYVGRRER